MLSNKNLMYVLGSIAIAVLLVVIMTHKIKNQVINELRQNYSPGPYQPGFNPDEVDSWKKVKGKPTSINTHDWTNRWENSRQ